MKYIKFLIILTIFFAIFYSCKEKDIFSVRLPDAQLGTISKNKVSYNKGAQLRFSKDKTLFFTSIENMLEYIKKDNWNLFKAGAKKAYVADYDKSKNKETEMWVNATVAFYTYIKDKNGKKILVAFENAKTIKKYEDKIILNNWKHIKSIKKHYFTYIELIRELRAGKK